MLGRLHIEQLSDMQRRVEEAIAEGRGDVVVTAPTGSGKTLAFLLPLTKLIDPGSSDVQAVVIVPGRELALQEDSVLRDMGSGLRSMCCYGGRPAMDEHRLMRKVAPHIVFGTPGRLNDHIAKGNIATQGIRYVVIDEFDKCLALGFHDEMARLLGRMKGVGRRFLFSATDAEQIPAFVRMRGVCRIDYGEKSGSGGKKRVDILQLRCPEKDKLPSLTRLLRLRGAESSIVFVNYRDAVERVADRLLDEGFTTVRLHGGMPQELREDQLYLFSNKSANILVSTDLASRGLDIPDVDNIVHYHLPETPEAYVHRNGRTARWNAGGRTFFLLSAAEQLPEYVGKDVETILLPSDEELPAPALPLMATLYIGKGRHDKISRADIVGFLCKQAGLQASEIGRIDVAQHHAYAAVAREKHRAVIAQTTGKKIKGVKTVVEERKPWES